jgi:hypothetical protein
MKQTLARLAACRAALSQLADAERETTGQQTKSRSYCGVAAALNEQHVAFFMNTIRS